MSGAGREPDIPKPPELNDLPQRTDRIAVGAPLGMDYQPALHLGKLLPDLDEDIRVGHHQERPDADPTSEHLSGSLAPKSGAAACAGLHMRPANLIVLNDHGAVVNGPDRTTLAALLEEPQLARRRRKRTAPATGPFDLIGHRLHRGSTVGTRSDRIAARRYESMVA